MKIQELKLTAIGPFSGLTCDFSRGDRGLHLIFGRNEAGKSSALRAIRYLLFGFPPRVSDDFRHPYPQLRVAARLTSDRGDELCVTRRKTAHKSLRDGHDDGEVDESVLRQFLGNGTEELFVRCFGIDHPTLVEGGREVVRGEGELGRLLFTGSGIAHLRDLEHQLEREAKELFSPQAQKPTINRLLREWKDARKSARDQQLRPAEWERHYHALREVVTRKVQLETERNRTREERDRLDRFQTALPRIAEYLELAAAEEQLRPIILLSPDFSQRREKTLRELSISRSRCDSALAEIQQREQSLSRLKTDENLLAHADRMRSMEKNVHRYEDAQTDRPTVVAGLHSLEREAQSVLRDLGEDVRLDQAAALILPTAERARIQQLAAAFESLVRSVDDARQLVGQAEFELSQLEQTLQALPSRPDTRELTLALHETLKLGNLEATWEENRTALQVESEEMELDLRRLPGWHGSLADVASVPVPAVETVDRFDEELRAADNVRRALREHIDEVQRNGAACQSELDDLHAHEEVPSADRLERLRNDRDRAWQLIRESWHPSDPVESRDRDRAPSDFATERLSQAVAYERLVTEADTLADRLRHEADRVARDAQLRSDLDRLRARQGELEQQRHQQDEAWSILQSRWQTLWAPLGIDAQSPREMRTWLTQFAAVRARTRTIRDLRRTEQTLGNTLRQQRDRLAAGLVAAGCHSHSAACTLATLMRIAQETIESCQELERQHRDATRDWERWRKEHEQRKRQLLAAEGRLQEWREQWRNAVARWPRGSSDTPEIANQVLEVLHQLSLRLTSAEQQRSRLQEIDSFSHQFEQQVHGLAREVASDLVLDGPIGQIAVHLLERFHRALETDKERRRLMEELAERKTRLEGAQAAAREQQAQLEQLCHEAGCETMEDLAVAWEQSERKRQWAESHLRVKNQLRELRAATSLEDFIYKARGENAELLPMRIRQLDEQIQELDRQLINEVGQAIGREEELLQQMDGSGAATAAEEAARDTVASLASCAGEYAVLRAAQFALRHGVDQYRSRHQEPMLQRAGEIFGRLTAGSFQGLKADYDAEGRPVVIGVRTASGESVQVAEMSDGTADQLYLALRYAWLWNYLDSHESLPFIVDDILLRFDDERAEHTLAVLGDLSQRTQVLFFTHHQHLIACAQRSLPPDVLFVHTLPRT